jgi:predicted ATPase with chaperone activity
MLARRLTTILPAMTLAEALETTWTHRVAGRTGDRTALVTTRPCRAPGEASVAHNGVRSLDELPVGTCQKTLGSHMLLKGSRFVTWGLPPIASPESPGQTPM